MEEKEQLRTVIQAHGLLIEQLLDLIEVCVRETKGKKIKFDNEDLQALYEPVREIYERDHS